MQRRGVRRRLVIIMGAGVVLAMAYGVGALKPVASGLSVLLRPFETALSRTGNSVSQWTHVIGTAGSLGRENQRLKEEVAALRQRVSEDTEIRAENAALKQQLGTSNVEPDRLLAAEVIAYQPDNFRQFVTISRGKRDGITPGMAVVVQGTLVGTVQETGPNTSKVFLVIDPNFRVAAIDQDSPNRSSGTIHGRIGSGLEMDKIAQTDTIKVGDTIVTSGLGGDIEKGLIIGRVQNVNKTDNGVFQSAQVTSSVPFSRLEIVYVVVRAQ